MVGKVGGCGQGYPGPMTISVAISAFLDFGCFTVSVIETYNDHAMGVVLK